jgi:hypothetical protein
VARGAISQDDTKLGILEQNGLLQDDQEQNQDQQAEPDKPSYVLMGTSSIPVSKKAGRRWKDKIDGALNAYDPVRQSWQIAFNAYRACSSDGIQWEGDQPKDIYFPDDTTENLTREAVKTILRTAYSANPDVNIATVDESDDDALQMYSAVLGQLLNRVNYPGLNGKARIRRWIMNGHLTNFGMLRLDYQAMDGSQQEAAANLLRLQEAVAKEKNLVKLEELYAELEIAEEFLSTTRLAGMCMENKNPARIIVDPDATYLDLSDCKWLAEEQFIGNAYIKKRFLEKKDGTWVRITDGKPPGGSDWNGENPSESGNDLRDSIADKILGVTSERLDSERNKERTRCWLIWDKLTRQISMWQDGAWDAPLYVWQDDLKLSRFYPYFLIAFTEPLDSIVQEGEQAQYAGHEREINKINKRVAWIRNVSFGALIYNSKKVTGDAVQRFVDFLKNPGEFTAFGIDWDPALKLKEMFDVFVPPDAEVQVLYDKGDLMKTINRVNSQNEVSQGGQFKTNTTNKAVEAYSQATASVKNELTDAIEDAMNDLVWAMLEIISSKYTKEQIIALVGPDLGKAFEPMPVEEFNYTYSAQVAAGSTEKPTSDNMKQEAMQIAQAVGQVGQATPMTSLMIIFKLFSKAFSRFVFTKKDEEMLTMEAQANLQKGISTPGGAPPAAGSPTGPVAAPGKPNAAPPVKAQ